MMTNLMIFVAVGYTLIVSKEEIWSRFEIWVIIFIMKIVHEVQQTKQKKEKKSAKRCKVLVCAQANNELFNVTESKVI